MSEHTPPVGIDHPTVVPANFDPDSGTSDGSNGTRSSVDGGRNGGPAGA